ncbi:MAG: hypothetical protein JW982_11180 [Spirochaetes bacterium]|nr:hypothetical protein [Spirochaetota bacterium]
MAELKASNSITEKFYKVRWEVNPSNAADIQYLQNLNNDYGFKSDRRAVIIPSRRGSITIKVFVTDKFTKMEFLIAERNIEVK